MIVVAEELLEHIPMDGPLEMIAILSHDTVEIMPPLFIAVDVVVDAVVEAIATSS